METSSDNGAVKIELPRATYRVDASADNGDVHVKVPTDDSGKHVVKARSSNGEVTLRTAN
ncbi:DUF4097 family beta strand repeat-containing protein [Streptomyces sp. H27-D2]|uniref:DUF4097 family beta strand repeat-containing protein n=1 Tax=Streptomyces sp. H27-D2 TaxID=3046304 RepID=UPI002DB974A7|nr:hypothetical protein [Streptomyces sp. H27-D2]MEC4016197.1 hypothetical protein [Streptomyces sp. H27-D2]